VLVLFNPKGWHQSDWREFSGGFGEFINNSRLVAEYGRRYLHGVELSSVVMIIYAGCKSLPSLLFLVN